MGEKYKELRESICADQVELSRFRELVINGLMATDLLDKDLKKLRNLRWEMAFSEKPRKSLGFFGDGRSASLAVSALATAPPNESLVELHSFNRKATIVIEHLIQASDVAHTMQVRVKPRDYVFD